jgi:hypothetical protein
MFSINCGGKDGSASDISGDEVGSVFTISDFWAAEPSAAAGTRERFLPRLLVLIYKRSNW